MLATARKVWRRARRASRRDPAHGPHRSRQSHFQEFVRSAHHDLSWPDQEKLIHDLQAKDYSILFHAWTQTGMIEFFLDLQRHLHFEFEMVQKWEIEVIFILRKQPGLGAVQYE